MTHVKLKLLYSIMKPLICMKNRSQAHLKTLSTKSIYKSYIYLIYMSYIPYKWTVNMLDIIVERVNVLTK